MATFIKDVTFDLEIEYNIKATSDVVSKDTGDVVKFDKKNVQKRKITLSGETLEEMQQDFSYAVGYNLSIEKMLEVIFSYIDMTNDVLMFGGSTDSSWRWWNSGAKDNFSNAFGKFILKDDRHWPEGGDPNEYTKKYFDDLNNAAIELGYTNIPN
jgi:hypothetical protein